MRTTPNKFIYSFIIADVFEFVRICNDLCCCNFMQDWDVYWSAMHENDPSIESDYLEWKWRSVGP